jgi:cytochrome P450
MGVAMPVGSRLRMRERYGPVFRTRDAIVGELVHVADRELVEQMFRWKPDRYAVAEPRAMMEPVVGASSLLLLDGAHHLRMRKLLLPPFHGEAIAAYAQLVEDVTRREIAGWRPGDVVRMRTVAQAITMEVIIRAVFGISDEERVAELKRRLPRLSSPNPLILLAPVDGRPRSPWGRFLRERRRVDQMIFEEIARRRAADDPGQDILGLLVAARDEDGAPLSDVEIRDELVTMLLAGHETTATSIAWAFERLTRTPEALERLAAGRDPEYLEAVIKETMRVRPVITEVFRGLTQTTRLGDYEFPPGTQLAAALLLIHFDEALYGPDAREFRPERFLGDAPEPYSWVPFGGGVRRCIGASFALLEMRVVIATVLAHATVSASRPGDERYRFRGVTLLPHRGGEIVVDRLR